MQTSSFAKLAVLFYFAIVGSAQASVTSIDTQAAFSALGTITQNVSFGSNNAWVNPGSPYVVGNLSFIAGGQNAIGGVQGYGMSQNLLTDRYIKGTTINISGSQDLFALNAGNFLGSGAATITITTNDATYQFNEAVPNAANGGSLKFFGFETSAGETFESVSVSGCNATGFTDIQIGSPPVPNVPGVSPVPEPTTYAMLLAGLGLIGLVAYRRKSDLSDMPAA